MIAIYFLLGIAGLLFVASPKLGRIFCGFLAAVGLLGFLVLGVWLGVYAYGEHQKEVAYEASQKNVVTLTPEQEAEYNRAAAAKAGKGVQ